MQSLRRCALYETPSLHALRHHAAVNASLRRSYGDWTPVFDRESGLTYYWNQKTDETTALGAPRPAVESHSLISTRTRELFQMGTIGFGFGLILSVVNKIL